MNENLETLTGRLIYTRRLSATDSPRGKDEEKTVMYEMRLVGPPPMLMTYPPSGPALGELHIPGQDQPAPYDEPLSIDMVLTALDRDVLNWQAIAPHTEVRRHETGWEVEFSTGDEEPQQYAVLTVDAMPARSFHIPPMPMHEWAIGEIPFPYLVEDACYTAEYWLAIPYGSMLDDPDATNMEDCREAAREALTARLESRGNSAFKEADVERYVSGIAKYIFVDPPSVSITDETVSQAIERVADLAWSDIMTTSFASENEQLDAFINAVLSSSPEDLAPLAEAGLLHKSGNPTSVVMDKCVSYLGGMLDLVEQVHLDLEKERDDG